MDIYTTQLLYLLASEFINGIQITDFKKVSNKSFSNKC